MTNVFRAPARLLAALFVSSIALLGALPIADAVPVQPSRPVSVYLLDEGSGTTTADSFGGNDGTLVAMEPGDWVTNTPFSYAGNHALNFDGTSEGASNQSDRVNLGQPANLNFEPSVDTFSISAWYQTDNDGSIVSKAQNTNSGRQYQIFDSGSNVGANLGGNQGIGTTTVNPGSGPGDWHHVVLVVTPTSAVGYLDGVVSSAEFSLTPGGPLTNPMDIYIGARHGSDTAGDATTGFVLDGRVDEVAFWDVALTTDNVQWLANNSLNDLQFIPEPSSGLLLLGATVLLRTRSRPRKARRT